jgi:hypothetical protein
VLKAFGCGFGENLGDMTALPAFSDDELYTAFLSIARSTYGAPSYIDSIREFEPELVVRVVRGKVDGMVAEERARAGARNSAANDVDAAARSDTQAAAASSAEEPARRRGWFHWLRGAKKQQVSPAPAGASAPQHPTTQASSLMH